MSTGQPRALSVPRGYGTEENVVLTTGVNIPELAVPERELTEWEIIKGESAILLGYTIPISGRHFLEYSLQVVTVVSVGHIGTTELAASSLATMVVNVSAMCVVQGFCTALDTLCPQAFTSRPAHTSLHALRTYFILSLIWLIQLAIFFNSEVILVAMRQDPDVAHHAATYLKVLSFGIPGYSAFECLRRWLQAQGLMVAPVLALLVAAPVNLVLNWLLVWGPVDWLRLGFVGAPLASALSMHIMFLVSLVYAIVVAPRTAWGGLTWAIFYDLGDNIRLGLGGTAFSMTEWWSWEIIGFASSFLGPTTLAAQSVVTTISSLFYQIPWALAVAGGVRIGNLLGAQRPKLARTASRVAMGLSVLIATANFVLLVGFKDKWGRLFSEQDDVVDIVASVLPLVAIFQLPDVLAGSTGWLLRGAGKPTIGAAINIVSYYIVGIPIGIGIAFWGPGLGLQGLWVGLTLALTGAAVLMSWVILRMDWRREGEMAAERAGLAAKRADERDEA